MSGSSSKPSSKGYVQVAQTEQIDDGVENPRTSIEVEDDEGLYSSSAPLLSNRTRGNEPPPPERKYCWYHKLGRWRPFRREPQFDSWSAPRKPRNWRRIFLWSLFAFMFSAILGLSISTGLLAREVDNRSRACSGCSRYRYQRSTRLPFSDAWKSSNNQLNFPRVYPSLDQNASPACRQAFNSLSYIQCHEKIWNRSWDNGKHGSLFDPDIALYSQAMCTPRCMQDIHRAFDLIASQCTEEDKFDMAYYQGPFLVDPELESGPVGVITTISNRMRHTCRQEPTYRYWNPMHCTTVMWEDWFIVDGMNAGNLEGIGTFESRTSVSQTERARYRSRSMTDTCDDAYYYGNRRTPERRFGPNVNSTTCDWCTMNWFERKLLAWKKDEVRDPKTGAVVGLPEYLKRIQHAGQRCDDDAWNRAWGRAIRKYKDSGDLDDDWENKDGKKEESDGKKKKNKEKIVGGKKVESNTMEPPVEILPDEDFHTLPVVYAELN